MAPQSSRRLPWSWLLAQALPVWEHLVVDAIHGALPISVMNDMLAGHAGCST